MQVLTRLHEAVGIDDFASTVDRVKSMVIDEEMAARHEKALKLWEEDDSVLEQLVGKIDAMEDKINNIIDMVGDIPRKNRKLNENLEGM